ncbi:Primase C terminal 2 (PriCT-2) [Rhizobium sp. RU20A]|uniref:DUF5906 domain-containing protein n=1 Tax=Rhizobium sp. RU20A TaxID=1907412 RepID=UPI00095486EF|nr:DUF5906 domain-containing protein [Rhizobium sp. RU20A]SIQ58088.1 Primase C terminal 2 (PriCT-2) [Rhizobium sp. RU20A]
MPEILKTAIERLAKAGFAIHWLYAKSKRPIGDGWASKPVASLADLERTYRPGNNVGVRLGKWSVVCDLFLHVIDVDIRKNELADEALDVLATMLPDLDQSSCPTVISGSGGESRHFYFLTDRAFTPRKFAHSDGFEMVWDESKQRDVKKWDWELHLMGTGSQVVLPPSIHPDTEKPYRWLRQFDFDTLELGLGPIIPANVIATMIEAPDEDADVSPERLQPLGLSESEIVGVLDDLPAAEWFEDRDQWMRVGMALHHETGGSDQGFDLWCKYSRLSEKFDEKDQKRVWKSFKNRAQLPFRMASLVSVVKDIRIEREFEDLGDDDLSFEDEFEDQSPDSDDDMFGDLLGTAPEKARKPGKAEIKLRKEQVEFDLGKKVPPKIQRLNRQHAIARAGGKTVVIDFRNDGTVSYGSISDLHSFYENDRVPKDDTTEPVSRAWMRSRYRRTYPNGIVFSPNEEIEGTYNLWQGFSVEPDDTKSCALFTQHLFEVICDKNAEHFEYAMDYFAHMIQRPEEKPGVAIVLVGKKGTGKDTIFDYISKIVFNHYVTIWNPDQFTGKFNAHQAHCLFLHVQEGFWAGDKRQEGALKATITSENAMIEPKGMNAFPVKSVLRIGISSNEKWVVPATEDERRFFVLNVSNKRLGDHPYFQKIRHEMNNGGPEALLAMLMDRDISNFQVRKVPNTIGLAEQKVEGLKNVERWWYETLDSAIIEGNGHIAADWFDSPLRIEKGDLRSVYANWLHRRHWQGSEANDTAFSKRLLTLVPSTEVGRTRSAGDRLRFFIVPPLPVCRAEFEAWLGSPIHWQESIQPAIAIDSTIIEDSIVDL